MPAVIQDLGWVSSVLLPLEYKSSSLIETPVVHAIRCHDFQETLLSLLLQKHCTKSKVKTVSHELPAILPLWHFVWFQGYQETVQSCLFVNDLQIILLSVTFSERWCQIIHQWFRSPALPNCLLEQRQFQLKVNMSTFWPLFISARSKVGLTSMLSATTTEMHPAS